jgi:glycosyltransferase involved in cell wall biosynthesis
MTQLFMQTTLGSLKPETFVICDSQHTKNDLCNYLPDLDPERVKVIYLAADDNFYQCADARLIAATKKKCGVPEGCSYLLALSSLVPRKNFPRTIRCFVRMLKESHVIDLYLVIVGEIGLDYEDILFEIESAGEFRSRILLAGYLPDEDLAPLYSGATAFVYLSFYEGFGLPPLEAMQCGTAVITSNTSSLPEVVGDAAIMVDPANEDAICDAMLNIYKDSSLQGSLSEKSLQRAKQFSWDRYNEQVINAYEEAL